MLCSFIPGHAVRLLMGAMHSWGRSDCGRHHLRVGPGWLFAGKPMDHFWKHPKSAIDTLRITQFNFVVFLIFPQFFQPCSSPKDPKSSSFCAIWWFHSRGISWSIGIGAFRRGLVPRIQMSCACSHRPRVYFDVENLPFVFFFSIPCMLDVDSSKDMISLSSFWLGGSGVSSSDILLWVCCIIDRFMLLGLCCKHTCQLTIIKSIII